MSSSRIRKEALYLSDKMAYELGLTNSQYDDIYEINYDFIYSLRNTLDYVVDGYQWAMDDYYDALDLRNDDLRWVLSSSQYRRFLKLEYFYRPIAVSSGSWFFRIYNVYTNRSLFYMSKPTIYRSYSGGHYRNNFNNQSHYQNKYKHNVYTGNTAIRNDKNFSSNRNSDFGSVNVRPNTSRQNDRNTVNTSNRRESTSSRRSSSSSDRQSSNTATRPTETNRSVNINTTRSQKSEQPVTGPTNTDRQSYGRSSSSSSSSSRSNSYNSSSSSSRGNSSSSVNSSSSSRRSSDSGTRSSSSSSDSSRRGRSGR
jgi:hypothetical protein